MTGGNKCLWILSLDFDIGNEKCCFGLCIKQLLYWSHLGKCVENQSAFILSNYFFGGKQASVCSSKLRDACFMLSVSASGELTFSGVWSDKGLSRLWFSSSHNFSAGRFLLKFHEILKTCFLWYFSSNSTHLYTFQTDHFFQTSL